MIGDKFNYTRKKCSTNNEDKKCVTLPILNIQ